VNLLQLTSLPHSTNARMIVPDIWFNPAFLRGFEDRGKTIVINEGSRETVGINAIPIY
jgi:hypothetical protein